MVALGAGLNDHLDQGAGFNLVIAGLAQGDGVHENIDLVGGAADEAVAAGLVEPFESDGFIVRSFAPLPGDGGAGALHLDDVDALPAARTQGRIADDPGAFVGERFAIVAQAGDVDHHVARE